MIKVKNRKVIHQLSFNTLRANTGRNIIAIFAIALTAILFTTVCTIFGTIIDSYQASSFREVGGYAHGTFKRITQEQVEELSNDPLIERSGRRLALGYSDYEMFPKDMAEISYIDETGADLHYITPEVGALPQENTNEIACDTYYLELLGVEPELGTEINLRYVIDTADGEKIIQEDTFTLSGWWSKNEALDVSFIQVPLSYAEEILSQYDNIELQEVIGTWSLEVYLKSSANIEADLETIAQNHGYQTTSRNEDTYIATGVNWGYLTARMSDMDLSSVFAVVLLILLIGFTGYLIIYNVFYISVGNDTRYYGLLKTIGTTGRQLRHMIRQQVLCLCVIGIPLGLIIGYVVGYVLAPVIISNFTFNYVEQKFHISVFILATVFSMITVLISSSKPGRIAGKVSPIEAVRYTESYSPTKMKQKSKKGKKASPLSMAWANLGRNKRKTILVLISLSLALLLLQITVTFTSGFDMDKYLKRKLAADFVVSDAAYFMVSSDTGAGISEDDITEIANQYGIEDSGRVYMEDPSDIGMYYTEEDYRKALEGSGWYTQDEIDSVVDQKKDYENGMIFDYLMLYGMEKFPLGQLNIIEGEIDSLQDTSQNSIAAVYQTDDYGNVDYSSNTRKLGDEVIIRYVSEWEYYDENTGEIYENPTDSELEVLSMRPKEEHNVTYTVTALVTVNNSMSFRYRSVDEFVLSADALKQEVGDKTANLFMFNTTGDAESGMETFVSDYTSEVNSSLNYESKALYIEDFNSYKSMFLILGGTLSFIVGLVGILNFFNSILTSILSRRRELAVLQSIGMTGKQLKIMLVWEGVLYTFITILIVLVLTVAMSPLLENLISGLFWFFSYRFTIVPIAVVTPVFLVLGVLLPLIVYRFVAKKTIVERLRESE